MVTRYTTPSLPCSKHVKSLKMGHVLRACPISLCGVTDIFQPDVSRRRRLGRFLFMSRVTVRRVAIPNPSSIQAV